MSINQPKCHFAKTKIQWLGYNITKSGIAPLETGTSAILNLTATKNLKQLRAFLGSVHYLGKFTLNFSQLCHPLRSLLERNTRFIWKYEIEAHFQHINNKVANVTENTHYKPLMGTRINCNASRAELGATLEQRSPKGWHTVSFASGFLNSNEERCSVNELELLGVVFSVE